MKQLDVSDGGIREVPVRALEHLPAGLRCALLSFMAATGVFCRLPAMAAVERAQAKESLPAFSSIPPAESLYYSEPDSSPPVHSMVVGRPPLQALISIDKHLDPFQLDAINARPVRLADVVDLALERNLDLQISSLDVRSNCWKRRGAYSRFLPDAKLGYSWYDLQGHARIPVSLAGSPLTLGALGPLHLDSPFIIAQAGVRYNIFQGGKVLFTALQSKNDLLASRWSYHADTNDVLMEATKRYYNLVLSEVLLQIRIRAVETSEENLRLNMDLEEGGRATHLDVLQALAQLADDRQNLIEQQIARRNAAIQLAEYLNSDQSIDLQPAEDVVQPVRLVDEDATPGKILAAAMEHRPELKAYREQWLSVKKNIMIAASPLYPTVQLSATEYGIGQTLSNSTHEVFTPITIGPNTYTVPAKVSRRVVGLGVLAVSVNWNLSAFGLTDFTNIRSARLLARQSMLRSNQEANVVISQVKQAYLNQLSALRRTEENVNRINYATGELRLARLRLQSGLGRNIDVLRAQQDLTDALVRHAQSTINFDIAQAQLLHDLGLISRDNLLAGAPLRL